MTRMTRHSVPAPWLALCLCLALVPAGAPPSRAADNPGWAIPQSLNIPFTCLRFMPVGICVWITCVGPFCEIDTSIKYGHFNPDAVVEVVNPQGVNRVEDPHRPDTRTRNHQNLIFKEAYALGHLFAGEIYCPSQAEALNPYFLSPLDATGWRWGMPDMLFPPAFVPGLREIGTWPLNTWGGVYPRSGWATQAEEPKAAAVAAQRVGDIITRDGQAHVYQAMTGEVVDGDKLTWPPGALKENTYKEGDWQMLHPERLPACEVFGENDIPSITGWGGGKVADDGDYAFTLWRPYTCCEIEGASLLFYVDFIDYPP